MIAKIQVVGFKPNTILRLLPLSHSYLFVPRPPQQIFTSPCYCEFKMIRGILRFYAFISYALCFNLISYTMS